jgi:hypothetical protein
MILVAVAVVVLLGFIVLAAWLGRRPLTDTDRACGAIEEMLSGHDEKPAPTPEG